MLKKNCSLLTHLFSATFLSYMYCFNYMLCVIKHFHTKVLNPRSPDQFYFKYLPMFLRTNVFCLFFVIICLPNLSNLVFYCLFLVKFSDYPFESDYFICTNKY